MSWSSQQQRRLGMEKGILEKKLKNVSWFNPTSRGNTRVEWRVNTNNRKGYTLRVYIPKDFPDQCPKNGCKLFLLAFEEKGWFTS